MVNLGRWKALDKLLGFENSSRPRNGASSRHQWLHEEERACKYPFLTLFEYRNLTGCFHEVLPHNRSEHLASAIAPLEVTKICLRLRHLITQCIPCEMEESEVTKSHSRIITQKVIKAAKEAGGSDHGACVVYCLLVNMRWFRQEAILQLWDAELHKLRAVACGIIAKQM